MIPRCSCGAVQRCYSVRSVGLLRTRYLRCTACDSRTKQIVRLSPVDGQPVFFDSSCYAVANGKATDAPEQVTLHESD